jgi:hypothetical protein
MPLEVTFYYKNLMFKYNFDYEKKTIIETKYTRNPIGENVKLHEIINNNIDLINFDEIVQVNIFNSGLYEIRSLEQNFLENIFKEIKLSEMKNCYCFQLKGNINFKNLVIPIYLKKIALMNVNNFDYVQIGKLKYLEELIISTEIGQTIEFPFIADDVKLNHKGDGKIKFSNIYNIEEIKLLKQENLSLKSELNQLREEFKNFRDEMIEHNKKYEKISKYPDLLKIFDE